VALRAGVIEIAIAARDLRPWTGRSENLFDGAAQAQEGWAQLVDRLQARLGETAVRGLHTLDEHRPERAWNTCAPGELGETDEGVLAARPLWLLPAPVPLAQNDGRPDLDGALALQRGPERIESGWWDGGDVMRDYFLAHSTRGARLWVFQERRTRRWFLQGIFS
jgi:protein ImuB